MTKDNKYKKPNGLFYLLFRLISKFIAKFSFNTKVVRNELKGVKGSYVVLANHEAFIDFINAASVIDRRCHFVVSNSFYQTIGIRFLLDRVRVIPKQQFQTSVADIRKMKTVIDNDMPLVIYPVGLMSEYGESDPIPLATAKFVKMLDTDVYICYSKGSYLTKPKWGKVKRKGQINIDIYKLFDRNTLKDIPNDELYNIINEKLFYNAYYNQEVEKTGFKNGDNIEGLENILYQCLKCGKEKVINAHASNRLKCSVCGYEVEADEYGFLKNINNEEIFFKYPTDWYKNIYNRLKIQVENGINLEVENHVTIMMIDYKKQKFIEVGEGNIKINQDNIFLTGKINNISVEKEFFISSFPYIPFSPGKHIELQDGQDVYRLIFDDKIEMSKFVVLLKVYHNRNIS